MPRLGHELINISNGKWESLQKQSEPILKETIVTIAVGLVNGLRLHSRACALYVFVKIQKETDSHSLV